MLSRRSSHTSPFPDPRLAVEADFPRLANEADFPRIQETMHGVNVGGSKTLKSSILARRNPVKTKLGHGGEDR